MQIVALRNLDRPNRRCGWHEGTGNVSMIRIEVFLWVQNLRCVSTSMANINRDQIPRTWSSAEQQDSLQDTTEPRSLRTARVTMSSKEGSQELPTMKYTDLIDCNGMISAQKSYYNYLTDGTI